MYIKAKELLAWYLWDQYCDKTGTNEWAINEGLMDGDEEIFFSEEDLKEYNLSEEKIKKLRAKKVENEMKQVITLEYDTNEPSSFLDALEVLVDKIESDHHKFKCGKSAYFEKIIQRLNDAKILLENDER